MSKFLSLATSSRALLTSGRVSAGSCYRGIATGRPSCVPCVAHLRQVQCALERRRGSLGFHHFASGRSLAFKQVVRNAHSTSTSLNDAGRKSGSKRTIRRRRRQRLLIFLAVYLAISLAAYHLHPPSRHLFLALTRCARLMNAVVLDVIDYKRTFAIAYELEAEGQQGEEERARRRQDRKDCHQRSAERMLKALKKNSGIYVKLGQHVASVQLLPGEWTSTMRPLQDQCFPTPLEDTDAMLKEDIGLGLNDLFTDFEPIPIGVASLAQVHRATDKRTGKRVAVKVQHADLKEFAKIDIATVNVAIKLVKYVFPDFEFTWLGEEMNHMLPLEMDFKHEAKNSARCVADFAPLRGKTSLYVPEVLWAEERCLVMEYIQGARVDNLAYLHEHNIDRNQVALELSRIFSQMVYLNGYFHADPHQGNILIRPKASTSKSPFNFDCVLLDHGQYFDVPDDLRVNYARLWLALIARSSPATNLERRKYAKLVGNIDDDLYPILESAITGRMGMADSDPSASDDPTIKRAKSLLDSGMGDNEMQLLRQAMVEKEGLITSVFDLLRRVPRRLLMILKLNDLTRSLDASLATTHGQSRVFIVVARYCAEAAWQDDLVQLAKQPLSFRTLGTLLSCWWKYQYMSTGLHLVEIGLDARARLIKLGLWLKGLRERGLQGAADAAAGLA